MREICSCDPSDALAEAALTLQYTFSASISEVVRITKFNVGITREVLFIVIKLIANTSLSREDYCVQLFSISPCFLWPSAEQLSRTFS